MFEKLPRQGPGDDESTKRAFGKLKGLPENPSILDIGCGAGMQTIALSKLTSGKITALDNHPFFIEILRKKIIDAGMQDKIKTVIGDMSTMDFSENSFDVIWSEGSSFIIGFENALKLWKKYLRPKGYLVISDLVWFTKEPPLKAKKFFEVSGASVFYFEDLFLKIASAGYENTDYFKLPDESWWTHFYAPMKELIEQKMIEYKGDKKSEEVLEMLKLETEIHEQYKEFYGYGFYVMRKDA